MLCALHRYYTWSMDMFFHVSFQLHFFEQTAIAAIPALMTNHTHCHRCIIGYSFTPESSEACAGKVPCPSKQQRNNVPILREEKHDISLQIRTTGSDIGKAPRSSHCATSLSKLILNC